MKIVELAKQLIEEKSLFLDTETTGLGLTDEITEIAVINNTGDTLLDTLIKPTIPIPTEATIIHGISNKDVVNAPSFADVLPTLQSVLNNQIIIIYNASYDVRMLEQSARTYNLDIDLSSNIHCAMEMFAEFYGDWDDYHQSYRWYKLEYAAKECGISMPKNLHRARTDAELARQIITFIANSKSSAS